MILYNKTKNLIISSNIDVADSFLKRLFGLILKKNPPSDYGLMIPHCISVHSCFMSFTIDVVFTNRDMMVIDIITLKPWRFSKIYFCSENVFEFRAGFVYDKISIGDLIEIKG
ncbi:MAG: DUF192 domain-containing protein [Elusimicrobiales bacterium]